MFYQFFIIFILCVFAFCKNICKMLANSQKSLSLKVSLFCSHSWLRIHLSKSFIHQLISLNTVKVTVFHSLWLPLFSRSVCQSKYCSFIDNLFCGCWLLTFLQSFPFFSFTARYPVQEWSLCICFFFSRVSDRSHIFFL